MRASSFMGRGGTLSCLAFRILYKDDAFCGKGRGTSMDTSDIRKGLKIMEDGSPFSVIDFQFVKPGKGQAFTRCKLRNMLNGNVIERTYKSGEKLEPADIEERSFQYIYPDGSDFVFMDAASGEQITVNGEKVGDDSAVAAGRHERRGDALQGRAGRHQPPGARGPPDRVERARREGRHGERRDQARARSPPARPSTSRSS